MAAAVFPVTTSWLDSPDSQDTMALTEYTRGVLYSSAFSSASINDRAIHTSRVKAAFDVLGATPLYRLGLGLLSLLREVERLHGGYWMLTPFRVVEVGSEKAFIGALPTSLERLGTVQAEGLGRFVDRATAADYPQQSLSNWMGVADETIEDRIATFLEAHVQNACPTIAATDTEYLLLSQAGPQGPTFRWSSRPFAVFEKEGIAICRRRCGGHPSYFSAKLRNQALVSEARIEGQFLRLLYAVASTFERPIRVSISHDQDAYGIAIPFRLPPEEYRLARLISRNISKHQGRSIFSVQARFVPVFLERLMSLGCVMETNT